MLTGFDLDLDFFRCWLWVFFLLSEFLDLLDLGLDLVFECELDREPEREREFEPEPE